MIVRYWIVEYREKKKRRRIEKKGVNCPKGKK